jgi:hydrogenase expression/formation protein HypE
VSLQRRRFGRPLDIRQGRIDLTHGSGGRAMAQLIEEVFEQGFDNPYLAQRNDQACFEVDGGRMVMTTDGFVISPLFFPGGDIGSLAVHGTINDVAMAGARPLFLASAMIIEEGFPLKELEAIVRSMAAASKEAGVPVVTGDTKVVERGKGDGIFITTTGIGVVPDGIWISAHRARPGDAILLSGSIGDHGIAVMSKRQDLGFETAILSDSAALHGLVERMVGAVPGIHAMRDPTRGGLAAVLNEIALESKVGIVVREDRIPVATAVRGACELLGLDPLYVANEGKLVAFCPEDQALNLLETMRADPLAKDAAIIGRVIEDERRLVQMETSFGGNRIIDWLSGDQLPRIC